MGIPPRRNMGFWGSVVFLVCLIWEFIRQGFAVSGVRDMVNPEHARLIDIAVCCVIGVLVFLYSSKSLAWLILKVRRSGNIYRRKISELQERVKTLESFINRETKRIREFKDSTYFAIDNARGKMLQSREVDMETRESVIRILEESCSSIRAFLLEKMPK